MERKKFLRSLSLMGLSGTALLSACNTTGSSDIGSDGNLQGDAFQVNQAAEREAVAIRTYTATTDSGLITDQSLMDTALLFRSHHQDHLIEFNNILQRLGASPIAVNDFSADNRIAEVTNQTEAIELAMALEMEAAQAYFEQSTVLIESPDPRRSLGNVFPIEVSHFVTLKMALGRQPAINAPFFDGLTIE